MVSVRPPQGSCVAAQIPTWRPGRLAVSLQEVDPLFAADGQVIGLKKKIWRYKDIVRKLLNGEPLTADEKDFVRKGGVIHGRGR